MHILFQCFFIGFMAFIEMVLWNFCVLFKVIRPPKTKGLFKRAPLKDALKVVVWDVFRRNGEGDFADEHTHTQRHYNYTI